MKIRLFMLLLGAVTVLVGCLSEPKELSLIPGWVEQGSGVFSAEGTVGLQGVGIAAGISDNDLAVKVSDRLAQQAIGPHLESLQKDIAQLYSKLNQGKSPPPAKAEIEEALRKFGESARKYVRTVDHWRNPDTTSYFSLARLDLEGMLAGLDQLYGINGNIREFIRGNIKPVIEKALASE